ncbi:MAG: hypothetical protein J0I75_17490 [Hyphomicrobium sp.]|nr:hypothetical protein [Hyphomicrobium sp.]
MHTSARAAATTTTTVAAPAIHAQTFNHNFLADVRIDHGPRDLYARLFLRGDTMLRERGINLTFAPLEELLEVNRRNSDSWRSLLPIFNVEDGGFADENGFCLLARTSSGQVVAAQAARVYDLTGTSFKDETESLKLFYPDPDAQVWYHPSMRKQGLTSILPRITKALSQTRWDTDITLSFMAEEVVKAGTAPRTGYAHVEWAIDLIETPVSPGTVHSALIWSNRDELVDYFSGLLAPRDTKVDPVVHHRTA